VHFKRLYKLNQELPEEKRINHYFTDIDFSWEGMTKEIYRNEYRGFLRRRDEIMAENFSKQYEKILSSKSNRNKCLVIMNYRHGFGPVKNENGELVGKNTAAFIMDGYPERSANILINTVALSFDISKYGVSVSSVQNGIWDNAFSVLGNRSLGFYFKNSPFGLDKFDMTIQRSWTNYNYQDVFTGFIFYKPLEDHITSMGFPGILSDNFEEIMIERASIIGNRASSEYDKKIKLLKENEVIENYASYSDLLPNKNVLLELIILLLGLVLSTLKFIPKYKRLQQTNSPT
jgi:hypothetical protein